MEYPMDLLNYLDRDEKRILIENAIVLGKYLSIEMIFLVSSSLRKSGENIYDYIRSIRNNYDKKNE